MTEKQRAARRFTIAFTLTLLICGSIFGFYTSAVNTETRIKGEDASAWVALPGDRLSARVHLMGQEWTLSLTVPNQAAEAVQKVHTVLPREYRMAKQGESLLKNLLDLLFGPSKQ